MMVLIDSWFNLMTLCAWCVVLFLMVCLCKRHNMNPLALDPFVYRRLPFQSLSLFWCIARIDYCSCVYCLYDPRKGAESTPNPIHCKDRGYIPYVVVLCDERATKIIDSHCHGSILYPKSVAHSLLEIKVDPRSSIPYTDMILVLQPWWKMILKSGWVCMHTVCINHLPWCLDKKAHASCESLMTI